MDVKARIGLLIQAQGAHRAATEIDTVARSTKRVGDETATTGRRMRAADRERSRFHQGLMGLAGAARFGVAALGGAGLVGVLHDSVKEYRAVWKVGEETNAVLKSTGGAANISGEGVKDLADSLSLKAGIDGKAIQAGENLLLTFRAIRNEAGRGNDIFSQTTKAAVDMSAAFTAAGKSMSVADASLQLGKALNDPAKGMMRLQRVGVSFTKGQIDQVKALEKSGHMLAAQKVILRELGSEFGGSAAATADPLQKLGVAWRRLEEMLGGVLTPVIAKGATALAKFVGQMQKGLGAGGQFRTVLIGVWTVVKAVAKFLWEHRRAVVAVVGAYLGFRAVKTTTDTIRKFRDVVNLASVAAARQRVVMLATAAAMYVERGAALAAAAGTKVFAAGQRVLNLVMRANPIVRVVTLLFALGAALVVAYHKVGWFRQAVQAVWGWIKSHWPLLLGILTGPIGLAVVFIVRHFDQIVSFVASLPGKIAHAASGMWNGLKGGAIAAVNWVIDRLNDFIKAYNDSVGALAGAIGIDVKVGTVSHVNPGGGGRKPDVSGFPSSVFGGSVPGMAAGGIVRRSGMAFVGEHGPELLGLPAGARVAPLPEHMDTTGGGMRLHPDDIRALAAAIAENPPEVHLDGRKFAENGRRHARRDAAARS